MTKSIKNLRIFNINTIKLLAAALMLVDHFAVIFYPNVLWLRIIGRPAMPLFAFAISEGCRYTRNKLKHFSLLFGLGAVCQIAYYVFDPTTIYFSILITFSFSVLLIYALQFAKKCLFDKECKIFGKIVSWSLFFALVAGAYIFCKNFEVDYGFFGVMLPVYASLFDFHRIPAPEYIKKLDVLPTRVLCMIIPLLCMVLTNELGWLLSYAFLSIPILLLYNGEKGKRKLKYFFYIFYPSHLVILYGIYLVLHLLG